MRNVERLSCHELKRRETTFVIKSMIGKRSSTSVDEILDKSL